MSRFAFDFQALDQTMFQRKKFRLADVKDKITKVAFDVVKFHDSDDLPKGLWQVHSAEDGEFLVAMYDEPEAVKEAVSSWSVIKNANNTHLNVFYQNVPIAKLGATQLGLAEDEVGLACDTLAQKLTDGKFAKLLLQELPLEERQAAVSRFPELGK